MNYPRIEEALCQPWEPPRRNLIAQRRALANNLPHRGFLNIIFEAVTDGDSNRTRKAHSCWLKSFAVGTRCRAEEDLVISLWLADLGVATPHEGVLVIQATIANYKVAWVFVDFGSFMDTLFKETFNQMQIDPGELRLLSTSLFSFVGAWSSITGTGQSFFVFGGGAP